jgi:hypothetical protein
MKKTLFALLLALITACPAYAQEFKVITIVESIVPGGIGRSRLIENQGSIDVNSITTEREEGKSKQGDVKRSDLKKEGENLKETKLLNFFSLAGINFGNIASNDAIIAAKMNEMAKAGWKLLHIASGVESDAGKDDGNGIFITRMYFVKE